MTSAVATDRQAPGRPVRGVWLAVAAALLLVALAYARARWPGWLPVGSDNDEYQLVAEALARFEAPVVAGVEGTKYPLGYPAVLSLFVWLGLPIGPSALVLNLVAVTVTVALLVAVVGRAAPPWSASPGAGLAAGALVTTSVSVWNDAFSIMPELVTLAVLAGVLAVVAGGLQGRRLIVLSALGVAAVLLKTLAAMVVVGGSLLLAAWVWLRRRQGADTAALTGGRDGSPWPLLWPAGASVVTVLAGMVVMRPFPDHTTGYVGTFLLRDPFDASVGSLGPLGLVRRTLADIPATLADLGRAMAWIDAGTTAAGVVAVVGLTLGVVAAFRLRPGGPLGVFVLGAVLAYVAGLSAWPYHSSRFGIPLVPVAALGVGWAVREVARLLAPPGRATVERVVAVALGVAVLAALVVTSWSAVVARGEEAEARLAMQHAALDTIAAWADAELGDDEVVVSFDYREVARRIDRTVQPFAYTADVAALSSMLGDADWVVQVDFHHRRNQQLALLLDAEPDRFERTVDGDGVGVWRVVG